MTESVQLGVPLKAPSSRRFAGALQGVLAALFTLLLPALPALAHNPDTSYARIRIAEDKLELRFTYDLVTLLKIAKLDERGSGLVTRADLKRHAPEIFNYLRKHIALAINEQESDLDSAGAFGWAADVGEAVPQKDFHSAAALIHFHFTQPLDDLPENVSIEFDFFADFGERHTVQGEFELKGEKHEVTFTRFEPDYLFDTGYRPPWFRRQAKWLRFSGGAVLAGLALWFLLRAARRSSPDGMRRASP